MRIYVRSISTTLTQVSLIIILIIQRSSIKLLSRVLGTALAYLLVLSPLGAKGNLSRKRLVCPLLVHKKQINSSIR